MAVLAGIDFFTVEVLTWSGLVTYYVLFFIHLESRRVSLAGITRHPDQAWMQQMARNATGESWGFLDQRRYVLHDRDSKFCSLFRATLKAGGIKPIPLPARSPNLNAYAERWVRSAKEECLTKLVLFGEASFLVKPRCDAHLPILLIIITGRGTTKGKATPSCSRPRKPGSTGPAAEYAVGSGSVGY